MPQDILYLCVDPDSLGLVCSYVHPKFYEYFFGQHEKLTVEDKIWFIREYLHVPFLESIWDEIDHTRKSRLCQELYRLAIQKNKFLMLQWLAEHNVYPSYGIMTYAKAIHQDFYFYLEQKFRRFTNIYDQRDRSKRKARRLFGH
jgi:hypothetical protein